MTFHENAPECAPLAGWDVLLWGVEIEHKPTLIHKLSDTPVIRPSAALLAAAKKASESVEAINLRQTKRQYVRTTRMSRTIKKEARIEDIVAFLSDKTENNRVGTAEMSQRFGLKMEATRKVLLSLVRAGRINGDNGARWGGGWRVWGK